MISLPNVTVKEKIYESSNSLVYRASRELDNLAVILKVLKQDYPAPSELVRYKQEYEITQSLKLEGVITVYVQQDYQRTLVMLLEDFGGESLEYWMRQQPHFCPTPLYAFLKLAIDITDILGRIHAAHVIHKDINPGNIVLNPDTGVVKIIDFGIATRFSRTNPTFKSPHMLEGTLAYLSPEQTGRMNRAIDYRTDFYSLGVTFYQLLTGQLPFPTTDILELIHCHIAKPPVPLHELNGTIPKPVSDIILKLMAKNAEDRYQSARGIKADLELCAEQLAASGQIASIQLGLQDVSDQFHIPQKLYGREAETAALLAAFERVITGFIADEADNESVHHTVKPSVISVSHPLPEMMLVSGYSGIGKSALVQELYKPITAKRGYFISGKFDQLQRNIPYSAIVDALQKLVQQLLGEPDEQLQQWRSRLLTALGSNGQLIVDVIPEVELIVGKQPPVAEVGATEAQNRFNLVFQQFIRVFCSKEHPLVIFLDDLQWIDSATLKLIELMLLDEQTQFLFLIGAYRDNEVSPTHPLVLTLEGLRKQGAVLHQIVLSPLTLEPLSKFIAEALYRDTHTVLPFAEFVLRKTGGNPFFVGEFLRLLYSENLLRFDVDRLSWRWNIDQIRAANITDNVVELLLNKLKKLPEASRQLLQLAACIGAEFDLETLAIVCEQLPKTVFQGLLAAIQTGLIQPLSELGEDLLVQDYKFLHDRVQQAAYALIDESQKQVIHLQIGRNLLEKTIPERLSERLFEIVDHLNHGIELVMNQAERNEIARLTLLAARRAKGAIAYDAAKKYLNIGIGLLTMDSWDSDFAFTLNLHTEAAEIAYLCGDFDELEQWTKLVLNHTTTILDQVKVYEIRISACVAQGKTLEAIDTGLQVLNTLDITLPKSPTQSNIQEQLAKTKAAWNGKIIADLIDLPLMTDPYKLAAISILSTITAAAYTAAPALLPLIICEQVNLSIAHGTIPLSAYAYAAYGVILNGILNDSRSAYQFGQLALNLVERLDAQALKCRTFHVVASASIHGTSHLKEALSLYQEAYISGIENGDLEYASYAAHSKCQYAYSIGSELTALEREMAKYSDAIAELKQETTLYWLQIFRQSVLNLLGREKNPCCLQGQAYNEERLLPLHLAANDRTALHYFYASKMVLCYLFGEFAQALDYAIAAEPCLDGVTGLANVPQFYFYDSLVRLMMYPSVAAEEQSQFLLKVADNQEKAQQWAEQAPMNFQHKYDLVEAEKSRILGHIVEAMDFYELAIKGARDNEYIQEEALAYELAAKLYLAREMEKFAQLYMKEAHYCYERWGATAKVKDLETRYPQLFPQSPNAVSAPVRATTGTTLNTSHTALDLATVMKAAQAISIEIELERLLSSLMQILIENAGAQTGCLLLENVGEWTIEAACELSAGAAACTTQVLQSIPTANRLPESVIQYVIRTHESIILNDATCEGNFISEAYIQQNQTRSLLCMPLLNQSKLVGVLYLENKLAAGAFTPERSQVLSLLSTQAAIAIENATLYSKLRASESQMTQFLEAIPVGIGIIDASGRPYYANQRGIQLLGKGVDPSILPTQLAEGYQFYVAGTDQIYLTENLPIIQALSGERTTIDDMEIRQNNVTIPVEVWGTPVFDEQGNVAYAIAAFQDITERKQAERLLADYNRTLEQQVTERTAALQQSEAELRALFAAVPDPLFVLTAEGRVIEAVELGTDRLYKSVEEQVGKTLHEIFSQAQADEFLSYIHQVLNTQQVLTVEYSLQMAGQQTWFSTRIAPIQSDQVIWLARDITDRKRAEEASIIEERNRMAREIHDTLAQAFTGVLVHMGTVSQLVTTNPEAVQTHINVVRELARNGLIEARRSVAALRPRSLEDGDLGTALEQFVSTMQSSTEAHLICEVIGTPYIMPADTENNLLRIGQEAFTNAIKYAQASEIRIELVYKSTFCCLRIKDNGRGFEANNKTLSRGFGLLGMTERAEQIGAQLSIESQLGQGTEVIVSIQREATT